MKKPWFLKGTTGEVLRDIRAEELGPFIVEHRPKHPGCPMIVGAERQFITFAIRGNSKQRRQQRRRIERWLNEGQPDG